MSRAGFLITGVLVRVVGQDVRNAGRDPATGRQMQELVGSMSVRGGSEDPCDQELRVRELFSEHAHERDRATLAHLHRIPAEKCA